MAVNVRALVVVFVFLVQCEGGVAQTPMDNRYGFADWHSDYPVALEFPQLSLSTTYDRSRRQALERIVGNLQGNSRREVWQFATEFFWRAPDEVIDPLVRAMDRAFGQPALSDLVRNILDAMSKMGRPEFDDAIRRALGHESAPVRQMAFAALATAGNTATIRWAFSFFFQMDGRARNGWLRAARIRLGSECVGYFQKLMVQETPAPIRDQVLEQVTELPPKEAAMILARLWPEAIGDFKAIIAGVLHAAGDPAGTLWLQTALREENHVVVVRALKQLVRGDLLALREQVLALSMSPRPEVRLGVANLLRVYDGKDVESVYEVLSRPEEMVDIKCIALHELTRRGRGDAVTALLEDVAVVTGTRLELELNLLVASGDDRGVAVFADRFAKSSPGEGREFLRALALCGSKAAPAVLLALFKGKARSIDTRGETTLSYIPILLPNLRGSEAELLSFFDQLDPADYVRRARYLDALSNIAADRIDPATKAPIVALLRKILFDPKEPAQMRVQALQSMLNKSITIEDAMLLKRHLASEEPETKESLAMRAFFKDFLNEFF